MGSMRPLCDGMGAHPQSLPPLLDYLVAVARFESGFELRVAPLFLIIPTILTEPFMGSGAVGRPEANAA